MVEPLASSYTCDLVGVSLSGLPIIIASTNRIPHDSWRLRCETWRRPLSGTGRGRRRPSKGPSLFTQNSRTLIFYSTQKLAPRSIILCMEASVLPGRVPPPGFVHNVAEVTHPGKTRPQAHRGRGEESEASPGLDGGVGCHPRAIDYLFSNLHCLHYLHVSARLEAGPWRRPPQD